MQQKGISIYMLTYFKIIFFCELDNKSTAKKHLKEEIQLYPIPNPQSIH